MRSVRNAKWDPGPLSGQQQQRRHHSSSDEEAEDDERSRLNKQHRGGGKGAARHHRHRQPPPPEEETYQDLPADAVPAVDDDDGENAYAEANNLLVGNGRYEGLLRADIFQPLLRLLTVNMQISSQL